VAVAELLISELLVLEENDIQDGGLTEAIRSRVRRAVDLPASGEHTAVELIKRLRVTGKAAERVVQLILPTVADAAAAAADDADDAEAAAVAPDVADVAAPTPPTSPPSPPSSPPTPPSPLSPASWEPLAVLSPTAEGCIAARFEQGIRYPTDDIIAMMKVLHLSSKKAVMKRFHSLRQMEGKGEAIGKTRRGGSRKKNCPGGCNAQLASRARQCQCGWHMKKE